MIRIIFYVCLFFTAFCWGCHEDDSIKTTRTVVVYLGVDNNFSGEEKEKIASLTEGWRKNFNGHLLVYADPGDNGKTGGTPYLTEIRWEGGQAVAREVKRYAESNSADPEVFRQVLTEIVHDYPADSYGLVVLSHGSGWLPSNTLGNARSVIQDNGKEMEIRDFVTALPVKMSFVIFDACLMGGVEVAYEFRDKADYLVISPAEVLVPGFVYTTMMKHLMQEQPDLTAVAREFYEYYDCREGYWRSATVSVIDVARMEKLAALCAELLLGKETERLTDLGCIQRFGYGRDKLYFDLGDYLRLLFPQREADIQQALDDCVLYKAHTPGYYSVATHSYSDINAYSGLTVYIPQARYPYLNGQYRKMKWTQRVNPFIPVSSDL